MHRCQPPCQPLPLRMPYARAVTVKHVKADTADNARAALRNSLGANSGAADIEAIEVDWVTEFKQYPDKFVDLASADVEGRWLEKAQSGAFGDLLVVIGLGTFVIGMTGWQPSPSLTGATLIVVAAASAAVRYLLQKRRG